MPIYTDQVGFGDTFGSQWIPKSSLGRPFRLKSVPKRSGLKSPGQVRNAPWRKNVPKGHWDPKNRFRASKRGTKRVPGVPKGTPILTILLKVFGLLKPDVFVVFFCGFFMFFSGTPSESILGGPKCQPILNTSVCVPFSVPRTHTHTHAHTHTHTHTHFPRVPRVPKGS